MTDRILRRADVETMTGYCERQLRALEQENRFPKRFPLNPEGNGRAVGWLLSEVQDWIRARAATREAA